MGKIEMKEKMGKMALAPAPQPGSWIAKMRDDQGMSTVEYAMGSLAAAALAAVLYMVINSGAVVDAIEGIITEALSNSPG